MLRLILLTLVLSLAVVPGARAEEFPIPAVSISGGDLPYPVTLAPADADAFRRRVNQFPRLEEPPAAQGISYTVTSSYWPLSVPLEEGEEALEFSVQAAYYPSGGFVRLSREASADADETVAWGVLNLRQRAILDRYIRLAQAEAIDEEPSTIAVLAAASAAGEALGMQAGPDVMTLEALQDLLARMAGAGEAVSLDPRVPPVSASGGFWLTATLLEGRTLQYYFDGSTLTESLGTERYESPDVASVLEGVRPAEIPTLVGQEPFGSRNWWPVMVGGGLISIAIAVVLRRKLA